MARILYGIEGNYIDVTMSALCNCVRRDGLLEVPRGEFERAHVFGDPLPNVVKHIAIRIDTGNGHSAPDRIVPSGELCVLSECAGRSAPFALPKTFRITDETMTKLGDLHKRLQFAGGSLQDELPEQQSILQFVASNATVLEIGANIGRSTVIIASVLDDSSRLVTLECDPGSTRGLQINKQLNKFQFHIEDSALSAIRLQQRGWDTLPVDENGLLRPGHTEVKTITWQQLVDKYPSYKFDTLVADCEGALYYILRDAPQMLDNIHTVVIENDFHDIEHKRFIDDLMTKNGLRRVFVRAGGWGCCQSFFFEVWQK